MSAVAHVSGLEFDKLIAGSDVPVLVDFYADWCGPCRAMGPVLERLASELAGRANILKVNVDEEPELAARFRVSSIPTLVLFRGGSVVSTLVGLRSANELRALLESAMPQPKTA